MSNEKTIFKETTSEISSCEGVEHLCTACSISSFICYFSNLKTLEVSSISSLWNVMELTVVLAAVWTAIILIVVLAAVLTVIILTVVLTVVLAVQWAVCLRPVIVLVTNKA